jgi:hypothetical protein
MSCIIDASLRKWLGQIQIPQSPLLIGQGYSDAEMN